MNIRADAAVVPYPDTYLNALSNRIFFEETETNADFFSNKAQFSIKPYPPAELVGLLSTATSDVGSLLSLLLEGLQDAAATAPVHLYRFSEYNDKLDSEENALPSLGRLGVVKGKCGKPRRISFIKELLDY